MVMFCVAAGSGPVFAVRPNFSHSVILNMANIGAFCCLLISVVSVNSLADPTLPGIFFPFGTDVGDSVLPVQDEASSPGIHIPTGFPFFNVSRHTVFVSFYTRRRFNFSECS